MIDGVQFVGNHDGEVTDLSMCQWMTTRLVSASVDGTVCFFSRVCTLRGTLLRSCFFNFHILYLVAVLQSPFEIPLLLLTCDL